MKITHNKVGQNLNTAETVKTEKSGRPKDKSSVEALLTGTAKPATDESSKVKLSERAQDIKKAKAIALATPDIREDKVAELQKRIDQGKYKVETKDIADKMIDEELQWN